VPLVRKKTSSRLDKKKFANDLEMKPGRFHFTKWPTTTLLAVSCFLVILCHHRTVSESIFNPSVTDSQFMTRAHSPYHIRDVIHIEKTGSLNIESGVVINFHPGAGILVKGALIAKVTHFEFS
jgi:hypothetical protein